MTIREGDWTLRKRLTIAICVLANINDGFDGMAAALVAPTLLQLWDLSPSTLGLMLSATPAGMILGTIALSPFADRYGRRRMIIVSQIIMLTGMSACAMATNVEQLTIFRFLTGIGIGCTISMVNLMGAEHAPLSKRTMAMLFISCGGPIGFLVGGLGAIPLLHFFPWQSIFIAGALMTVVVLTLVVLWLPESPVFLAERAAAKVERRVRAPVLQVLRGQMLAGTMALAVAFIAVSTASHFLQLWTPASLVRAGLSLSGGLSGSVLLSLGMVVGMIIFAFVANRWGIRRMGVAVMILAFILACAFAVAPMNLAILLPLAFLAGAFLAPSAGTTYAMIPYVFPPMVRATGTAVAVGAGRLGAILGPIAGGALVDAGLSRTAYSIILAVPFLIAALALAFTPMIEKEHGRRVAKGVG